MEPPNDHKVYNSQYFGGKERWEGKSSERGLIGVLNGTELGALTGKRAGKRAGKRNKTYHDEGAAQVRMERGAAPLAGKVKVPGSYFFGSTVSFIALPTRNFRVVLAGI